MTPAADTPDQKVHAATQDFPAMVDQAADIINSGGSLANFVEGLTGMAVAKIMLALAERGITNEQFVQALQTTAA